MDIHFLAVIDPLILHSIPRHLFIYYSIYFVCVCFHLILSCDLAGVHLYFTAVIDSQVKAESARNARESEARSHDEGHVLTGLNRCVHHAHVGRIPRG